MNASLQAELIKRITPQQNQGIQTLIREISTPYYNPQLVQQSLGYLLDTLNCLIKYSKELNLFSNEVDSESAIFSALIPREYHSNDILAEFFFFNERYALFKKTAPEQFLVKFQGVLDKLKNFFPRELDIQVFKFNLSFLEKMIPILDDKEKRDVYRTLDILLQNGAFPLTLFVMALPYGDPDRKQSYMELRLKDWNDRFGKSLSRGDIGGVQDCLADLLVPKWLGGFVSIEDLISRQASQKSKQYLSALYCRKQKVVLKQNLQELVESYYKDSMQDVTSLLHSIQDKLAKEQHILASDLLEHIRHFPEFGISIGLLQLLRQFCESVKQSDDSILHENQLRIALAVIKNDLEGLELILKESHMQLWETFSNDLSPLSLATKLATLHQRKSQKILGAPAFDPLAKRKAQEFYLSFHRILQKRLQISHPQSYGREVMKVFDEVAWHSNQVFLSRKKAIFQGCWDALTTTLIKLLEIYIPQNEHSFWMKHCPPLPKEKMAAKTAVGSAYLGSQRMYGLWFHLTSMACVEYIKEGCEWNFLLNFLGKSRQMIALYILQIQIPRNNSLSYAARKKLRRVENRFGKPLGFGVYRADYPNFTPISQNRNSHYLKMTQALISLFNDVYSEEMNSLLYSGNHSGHGKRFEFNNWEFVVYPPWNEQTGSKPVYVITHPLKINKTSVAGTQTLWNWPPYILYLLNGSQTICLVKEFPGVWVHASGENKKQIDSEIGNIFQQIVHHKDWPETEKRLASLMYLFFQSTVYFRGTGAIGMILMEALLSIHGKISPNAAPVGFGLDNEAMCRTKDDFTKKFIAWLNGENAFEYPKYIN